MNEPNIKRYMATKLLPIQQTCTTFEDLYQSIIANIAYNNKNYNFFSLYFMISFPQWSFSSS